MEGFSVDGQAVRTLFAPAGSVPKRKRRSKFRENNGNSYMFGTILVAAITPCMIVMVQQAPCQATRIVFTIFAALSSIVAALNFLAFSYREWNKQLIEISPGLPEALMPVFLADIPWRVWRLADCVCSWVLAVANLILALWIWDKSADKGTYFLFCLEHTGCHNIWSAWLLCILQSINYFVGAAADLRARSELAIALASITSMVGWFVAQLVAVATIAKALELLRLQLVGAGASEGARKLSKRALNELVAEVARVLEEQRRERKRLKRASRPEWQPNF